MDIPKLYMVFDVESAGLHGEGFAVGYVVVDENGAELDADIAATQQIPSCSEENRQWLESNVLPSLANADGTDDASTRWVRNWFWWRWQGWKDKGAQLVTDCGWPVEANFLSACVRENKIEREWGGPYPLLDLSSILLAAGKDPVGTFERLPNELPAHNPLNDARQSARVLTETLKELRRDSH